MQATRELLRTRFSVVKVRHVEVYTQTTEVIELELEESRGSFS